MRRKPMAERLERIRQLAGVGWTAERIANKLGLARATIYSYANLNDIVLPKAENAYWAARRRLWAEIVEHVKANPRETQVAVAARFGVAPATVVTALRRAGISPVRQYDEAGNLVDRAIPAA